MSVTGRSARPAVEALSLFSKVLDHPRSGWRPHGRVEDLGGGVARLEVRRGERRQPGDDPSVVDTEEVFVVTIVKQPRS